MQFVRNLLLGCTLIVLICVAANAQNTVTATATTVVPRLVNFSGSAVNDQGKPVTGIVGVTFCIYNAQEGGAPLWMETQNVTADAKGNYTVQLGATTSEGLPLDVFTSGEGRWLGVRVNGGEEQPRVLLLSVPYALKAADAQTLGGLPASAFALAGSSGSAAQATPESSSPANTAVPAVGGGGLENYIPIWADNNDDLANSILYQTGSGSGAKIGVNTTKPLFTLDVNGQELVRGLFEMATQNYASKTKGYDSQPLNFESSAFNSTTNTYTLNHFQWQAEPTGNNTTTPGATLNLLYGTDPNPPAETGLNIASTGQITFATGQTFPGTGTITGVTTASGSGLSGGGTSGNLNLSLVNTCATNQVLQWNGSAWACFSAGNGTITGVTAGTDLTGGGTSGNVTLNLDTTQVPLLNAANTFTGVQAVNVPPLSGYPAITANDTSSTGAGGVLAISTNGTAVGASSTNGNAVSATSTNATGVVGAGITGVSGTGVVGVYGGGGNYGVQGVVTYGIGVYGAAGDSDSAIGVYGAGEYGVQGIGNSYGVYATGGIYGVLGESGSSSGSGGGFSNSTTGDALFTYNQSGGYAAFFDGNVDVDGKLSKAGGQFHIDHPLDPANKYLNHSFVESPDMMNIYNGNATLDANGEATVQMPDWFGVLNRDFRYQLTCIGGFAPVYVAEKLANNQFKIGGGRAGLEVSWQITGIRQDAWANANRIPVEEEKEANLKGFYLHPQLYGAPAEKGISWARHPEMMEKLQQDEEQMKEKQAGLSESPMIPTPPRPIPPPLPGKPAPLIPPAPLPHRVTK
jgi:trimeric autotransporter adhesin